MHKVWAKAGSIFMACVGLLVLTGTGSCPKQVRNPIIFVHGGSGSGAQFESQALRFTSNGYKQQEIRVLEYDSSSIQDILPDVLASLDDLIAELQTEFGVTQVDLLGHSLGTFVSQTYLSTPERAATVAHYVNIDGASAAAPPGGVPTLALWAGDAPPIGEIVGAKNVTLEGQEHVQSATSPEAFVEMFKFFRGHPPFTSEVRPQLLPRISGRATLFPQNSGLDGATVEVWIVDGDTGERIGGQPQETFAIGPDGNWGPFTAVLGLHYELAVLREGEVDINYFYEPFLRSDDLVRLNVAVGLQPFITQSDDHVALTVVRFKEMVGDKGPGLDDVLEIDGTNVINPTVFSTASVAEGSVAYFAFDTSPAPPPFPGPPDGMTDLLFVPFVFGQLPFLTASDLVIPTSPPGSVAVTLIPQGNPGDARTVNVPNIPSSQGRVVVSFYDFEP